jgi:glucose/arabinose dehydrogenase
MKTKRFSRSFPIGVFLLVLGLFACHAEDGIYHSEAAGFKVEVVADGLSYPWGMVFLPDGDILVTERPGTLRMIRAGALLPEAIAGLPATEEIGQGGLMGIALDPGFAENHLIYLTHATGAGDLYGTEVVRGRLEGMALQDVATIFRALPKAEGGRHFGSRLLFAPDGTLYITLGERGASPSLEDQHPAQHLDSHLGSLIRINPDGSVPPDNPFVGRPGALPEIYSYGHRNMQGMALNPATGAVWTHEHGPQGGDEINIIKAGANYGWPVITYGVNYGIGTKIGEGTHKAGMEQPIHYWVPSIAPSGMAFYTGDQFPAWKGNLFVGSLKFGMLVRLTLNGDTITGEERLLDFDYGRIRDVVQGPDGLLYLLTDDADGKLLRIAPVTK